MLPFKPKIYGTTVMNDKGQVVIPAEARAELGLEPGTRLVIMSTPLESSVAVVNVKVLEEQANLWKDVINAPDEDTDE